MQRVCPPPLAQPNEKSDAADETGPQMRYDEQAEQSNNHRGA